MQLDKEKYITEKGVYHEGEEGLSMQQSSELIVCEEECMRMFLTLACELYLLHQMGKVFFLFDEMLVQGKTCGIEQKPALAGRQDNVYREGERIPYEATEPIWHDLRYPPEYRKCFLRGEACTPTKSGNLYMLFTGMFGLITGGKLPNQFYMNGKGKEMLYAAMKDWDPVFRDNFITLFQMNTRIIAGKRLPDAKALLGREEFKKCLSASLQKGIKPDIVIE